MPQPTPSRPAVEPDFEPTIVSMLAGYFRNLYARTMRESYARAGREIHAALADDGLCLDCGAGRGHWYQRLNEAIGLDAARYRGIEWDAESVVSARDRGLEVVRGDLNRVLPFPEGEFRCIFALSVLEHLLNPCRFLRECRRCLEPGGTLILLTPNISTYFTAALILWGKMPSSGPHPDSNELLQREELFRVRPEGLEPDAESDTPVHRHLVVFSYRVLRSYLEVLGFDEISGSGHGLYPFPNLLQPGLEKIDPYHCHQMVFVARKPVA